MSNFEQEIVNLSGTDRMNSVNLFGVPLSDLGQSYRDTEKANKETQNLLKDLVSMVDEIDRDNVS